MLLLWPTKRSLERANEHVLFRVWFVFQSRDRTSVSCSSCWALSFHTLTNRPHGRSPVSPTKSWDMHLWKSSGLELMPKGKSRAKWCDKRPPYLHARRMCQKLDCASNFEKIKNVAPFHWASNCAIDDNVCSSLHNASLCLVRSTHILYFFFHWA